MLVQLIRGGMIFYFLFAPVYAQLFLTVGSPAPKYNETFASALFQVTDKGSVQSVAEF